jgi:putative oxidoreductase
MELVVLIGRVLFSLLFLHSGISHLTQRVGMTAYAKGAGVPMPDVAVTATGLMILAGGLSVLLGFYPRLGAWLLVAFLVPVAFTIHKFWGLADPAQAANQRAHFEKNISLAGGAMIIAYFGTGPYSLTP